MSSSSLKILSWQTDGGMATLLHIASQCNHIEVLQWLLMNGASVTTKNAQGQTAFESAHLECRKQFFFAGQYLLDQRPKHQSSTSIVRLAQDIMATNGGHVAIKFMLNRAECEREFDIRENTVDADEAYIIPILQPASPCVDATCVCELCASIQSGQVVWHIMRNGCNLAIVLEASHEDLADFVQHNTEMELGLIRRFSHQLAKCISWVHSRGCVHTDVKARNILATS